MFQVLIVFQLFLRLIRSLEFAVALVYPKARGFQDKINLLSS